MTPGFRRAAIGGVLAVSAALLTACTASPSPFDGPRTSEDAVPADAVTYVEGGDLSSSRYQGHADDHALYLLKGTGEMRFCLVYTDGTEAGSVATCSGGGWLKLTTPGGAEFLAQLAGFEDEPGRDEVQVSPWVRQTRQGRDE